MALKHILQKLHYVAMILLFLLVISQTIPITEARPLMMRRQQVRTEQPCHEAQDAARTTPTEVQKVGRYGPLYFNMLPKGMKHPPSGPSTKTNNIID